jgi:pre-rRNA-processing protein TSR4
LKGMVGGAGDEQVPYPDTGTGTETEIDTDPKPVTDGEDDDEDDVDTQGSSEVQLGFIESEQNLLFADHNWRKWDGGRVGGRPVWLDPVHLPAAQSLLCGCCRQPMLFLLQIYCPVEEVAAAFHRALYLFCCRRRDCVHGDGGGVRCFRAQLPRRNALYPYESGEAGAVASPAPQCALCG